MGLEPVRERLFEGSLREGWIDDSTGFPETACPEKARIRRAAVRGGRSIEFEWLNENAAQDLSSPWAAGLEPGSLACKGLQTLNFTIPLDRVPPAFYLTTSTGTGEISTTRLATDPNRIRASPVLPRAAMTMRSHPLARTYSAIISASSPTPI